MKKRYLILAGLLMAVQIFAAVPAAVAETNGVAETLETGDEALEEPEEDPEQDGIVEWEDYMEDAEGDVELEEAPEEEAEKLPRPEYDFHDYLKELGEYKNLTVEVSPLEEVTDEIVMNEINGRMYDFMDKITEGTVEEGDIANIDYVGKKDDVAFDGGTAEGADLEIGSGSFIEGFEAGLVGVKIGDTVDLNLTFPEEYPSEDLAGAEVVFTVTVNYVQRVGEFSDEAAEKLSDGECKDMASYQAAVKEELENNNKEMQKSEAENAIWEKVLENTVFESMPEDVLDYDIQQQLDYEENVLALYYGMSLEDYCTSYGMSVDQYKEMIRESMEMYLRYEMVQQAILEAENMTFNDEDFKEYAGSYAAEYGYELDEFLELEEETNIWRMFYYEKASEFLMNHNSYTEAALEDVIGDAEEDILEEAEEDVMEEAEVTVIENEEDAAEAAEESAEEAEEDIE